MSVLECFSLAHKTIVVTGGEGRLGQQWCRAIREAEGVAVSVDLHDYGRATANRVFTTDITVEGFVYDTLAEILAINGRVDGLVNAAAFNPSPEQRAGDRDWDQQLAVSLTGAQYCIEACGNVMVRQGSGVIVLIGSDLSLLGPTPHLYAGQTMKPAHYSVAKHGVIGLMRYYAMQWAKTGVRVNALCPGAVDFGDMTPEFRAQLEVLIPMGRTARPNDYDGALVFLLSDASRYMTGSVLVVDGGRTCW